MLQRYSRGFRAGSNAFVVFGVPAVGLLLAGRTFRSLPLLAAGGIWLALGALVLAVWLRPRLR